MVSSSNRRVVDSATFLGASSCEDGNGDKASTEENVKDEAEESEEGDTAKETCKDDGESGIDNSCPRHTLDGLLPSWNILVVVC